MLNKTKYVLNGDLSIPERLNGARLAFAEHKAETQVAYKSSSAPGTDPSVNNGSR